MSQIDSNAAQFARMGDPWDSPEVRKELARAVPVRGGRRMVKPKMELREVKVPDPRLAGIRDDMDMRHMFCAFRGGSRTTAPAAGRERVPIVATHHHAQMSEFSSRAFEAPSDPMTACPEPRVNVDANAQRNRDQSLLRDLELAVASCKARLAKSE